jgi:hypothetical protein
VAVNVRSIALHEFTSFEQPKPTREDPIYEKIRDLGKIDNVRIALAWTRRLAEKGDKILETVTPILKQRPEKAATQDHAISALATIPPSKLLEKREFMLGILRSTSSQSSIQVVQDVDSLLLQGLLYDNLISSRQLTKLNFLLEKFNLYMNLLKSLGRAIQKFCKLY